MARKTKDQRRLDYLDLGAELIDESTNRPMRHGGFALAYVKLADVADRADVTKGALYHIWSSQEDYWRDLAGHFLREDPIVPAELAAELDRRAGSSDATGLERLRVCATVLEERLGRWAPFLSRIGLVAYLDDPELTELMQSDFADAIGQLSPILERTLVETRRQPRSGVLVHDICAALFGALAGAVAMQRSLAGAEAGDGAGAGAGGGAGAAGAGLPALAHTFEAITVGMTEPLTGRES